MAQADFTHSERGSGHPAVATAKAAATIARRAYDRGYRLLNTFVMDTLGFRMTGVDPTMAEAAESTAADIAEDSAATDRIERLRAPLLAGSIAILSFGYLVLNAFPDYYVLLIALGFAVAAAFSWGPPALDAQSQPFPDRGGASDSLRRFAVTLRGTITPAVLGLLLGIIVWQVSMWEALYLVLGLPPASWCTCAA